MKLLPVVVLLLTQGVLAQEMPKHKLLVEVSNLTNQKGHKLYVGLYRQQDQFPEFNHNYMNRVIEVRSATVTVMFEVPFGSYAIALSHDLNDNGEIDKNLFGYPKEPFGFSQNRKPKLGPPGFDECKFNFEKDNQQLTIAAIH